MASTYTTGFGIEKIGTGEQDGTWGTTTNHNLDIIDRIASYKAVAITTNADTATLTVREASPGSGTENLQDGMYRVIKFTGALDSDCTVTIAPNTAPAWFIIENATTDSGSSGPYSVILTQGSGANVTVQNGKNAVVYCDGAGSGAAVVDALADLQVGTLEVTGAAAIDGAATLGSTLAVTGAVTGSSTIQGTTITATTAFVPDASDGAALGTTSLEFSDLYLADGAVIGFGDDQDVTLTHVADTGLLLNSTMALQFNDASQYINAPSATILDINATDEVEVNATLMDVNANLDVSGTIVGASTIQGTTITATGNLVASGTVEPAGDTAAGDNAAIGYTAAEGLILTGQGSTSDLTVKNDADETVFSIPTGTDDVLFPDNAQLQFGAGSDLRLVHDGNNSYIIDQGTGGLYIQGDTFANIGSPSGETGLSYTKDGAVSLYHDNNLRLATSTVGVSVTGNIVPASADGGRLGQADLEWADLYLADSSTIQFGNDQDVTLTHVADTGLLLNSTRQLQFGDSGTYIHQSADGVLDLVSDTEIEINATTIDINGAVDVSGALTVGGVTTLGGAVAGADQTVARVNLKDYGEVTSALGSGGGSRTIDLEDGNNFTATVSSSTVTWTFSNPTASDELCGFTLFLTNGGSQTVNWPASVDWAGGTAPTLTTSGLDILVFVTTDGGTIWHGMVGSADSKSPS